MRIVAGRWGGRRIQAPPGKGVRPTTDRVREAWMSVLAPELPGARVMDLFAGSGALGVEALSRGAAHCTFVERSPAALRALRANLQSLGADDVEVEVVRGDVFRYLGGAGVPGPDIALADPPYGAGLAARLIEGFAGKPFARLLCVEHRHDEAVPDAPGRDQRRYGDTMLTFIPAPP